MKPDMKKELEEYIATCFYNRNLCMDDIVKIMEMAREQYNLDSAIIATNKEYKYQLNMIVLCKRDDVLIKQGRGIMLTSKQYDEMVHSFIEHPISNIPIAALKEGYQGDILRCAIMKKNQYYGHVGFCSKEKREWTEEEKNTLSNLSYLLLIFFGLNYLNEGLNRYDHQMMKFENETISSGFFLNLKYGKCHAMKLAPFLKEYVDEWKVYDEFLEEYTGNYIDPIYGRQIMDGFHLEALKKTLSMKNPIISTDFPRVVDGQVGWYRYVVELMDCDEQNIPHKAFFYFRDITHEMQNKAYLSISNMSSMNNNSYVIISSIDLDTEQYAIYVDNRTSAERERDFISYGGYRELVDKIAEEAIDREYAGTFKQLFSLENLREYFEKNQEVLKFEFPYKDNQTTYWVRLDAVRTQHFSDNGKKVVLYFSDITEQKAKELQLQKVRRNLEKEHERVLEVELKAMIDPLTGAYNRAGFDRFVKKCQKEKCSIGFVLIDIDNFKTINDNYGHELGDEVLMMVAKRLQASFRNEDKVFRLGGDEFALLLPGCNNDIWHSLQMKFSSIHHYLKETIRDDVLVTLSAGFCISDCGYEENLIKFADEALYHTKNEGRAGLTQIDKNHQIVQFWQDTELLNHNNVIPKAAIIGNWRVEFSDDETQRPCLFLDETAHIILGISNVLTPEECFELWRERIVERHQELYDEMKARLIATGQAECTYHWTHPSQGEISLRAGAKYRENGRKKEIFGYMQELKDSDIVLSYDDGQFLMQAMNRIYFCTYYFNLDTRDYYIVKGHENEKDVKEKHQNIDLTFQEFVQGFVHPDYQKKVAAFADLNTLSERLKDKAYIDCEYLSSTKLGWCRTRFMPVKWDENGKLTHAVSMSACIDEDKKAQKKKEEAIREAMRIQIRIGEMTSKSTIVQSGTMDKKTGEIRTWLDYLNGDGKRTYNFEQLKQKGYSRIPEKELSRYQEEFDLSRIVNTVEKNGKCVITARMRNERDELHVYACHYETLKSDKSKLVAVVEDVTNTIPKGIEWMQQFDILESINEAIAIFDYDTYEIVFMNKIAREMIGQDVKQYRSKKCYELFSDVDGPCTFCDHVLLSEGGNGFMYREIKGTNQTFLLHGSVMEINGKKYRVEQAVPASEIDESIEHLQGLLSTEQKLMACVQNLIRITDIDQALKFLLDEIAAYYDCDRVCLSKLTGEQQGTLIMERCVKEQQEKFFPGEVLPLADFMQWETVYSPIQLRKVYCEGNESSEQKWMKEEGLDNLMILSFEYGNNEIGYISIDNIKRHKEDSNWIGTLAFFIANELQKKE